MGSSLSPNFGSYRQILRLSGPLIFAQSGVMLMHFVDAIFLFHYSADAMAAVVPSGMVFGSVIALFQGIAAYTTTFVAQYVGANRPDRVGAVVWQGIWVSLVCGLLIAALSVFSNMLFFSLGHPPEIAALESEFFRICCYGGPFFLAAAAISGFFSGRADNFSLAVGQVAGLLVTILLDYALIFGEWGFPEMGIRGAAIATVLGQVAIVLVLALLALRRRHRATFNTWRGRAFDPVLMARLVRFGIPAGGRLLIEFGAWTLFIIFIGRIGTPEEQKINLAANNIVMRINTFAFLPIMGIGTAVATLVGQAQGASRPDLSARCAWRGLLIAETWMFINALAFVLFPSQLIGLFHNQNTGGEAEFLRILEVARPLMYLVAFYCLFDAGNVVILGSLQGAGDTRFTAILSVLLNFLFLSVLFILDYLHSSVYAVWIAGTLMIACYAVAWLLRFLGGRWRTMRVIEPEIIEQLPLAERTPSA